MWGRPDNSNDTLKDYKFGKSIFHSKSVKFVVIHIILHYFNFMPCFKAEVKKTNIKTSHLETNKFYPKSEPLIIIKLIIKHNIIYNVSYS